MGSTFTTIAAPLLAFNNLELRDADENRTFCTLVGTQTLV